MILVFTFYISTSLVCRLHSWLYCYYNFLVIYRWEILLSNKSVISTSGYTHRGVFLKVWGTSLGFPCGASGNEPGCQCRRCKMRVQSLGWEDPLEEGMATHSSILTWRIPWTEEPGGLQTRGSQKAGLKLFSMHVARDFPGGSSIHLLMHGTWVWSPVQEDSTCWRSN